MLVPFIVMTLHLMVDLNVPIEQVEKAHDGDLHCVDWNPHDVNYILTGYVMSQALQTKMITTDNLL